MAVVILAGGLGTRLQEETTMRPKPMVEIGGRPILWHIMKQYAAFGQDDFVIACGYKSDFIKNYFLDQYNLSGNLKIDFQRGMVQREESEAENWTVNLVDTGLLTSTGGRLLRLKSWLDKSTFLLQQPASLVGIGVCGIVEMWEISFFIKERNPACHVIRWKSGHFESWRWIETIESVRGAEGGCIFEVVPYAAF